MHPGDHDCAQRIAVSVHSHHATAVFEGPLIDSSVSHEAIEASVHLIPIKVQMKVNT